MTIDTLPPPADLKRLLSRMLPGDGRHAEVDGITVTPRDARGRRAPVYDADFYEIAAFYVTSDVARLDVLEAALSHIPGVYRTTRVLPVEDHSQIQDPQWPVASTRRDKSLRVMALALMRDSGDKWWSGWRGRTVEEMVARSR
jgi:hypothetical protein